MTRFAVMKLALTFAALMGLCPAGACLADSVNVPYEMGGAYSLPVTSMKAARFRAMVHQQYDFSCGSAALSTLLTYHYGFKVTEQTVFEEMYAMGDQPKIRREGFSLVRHEALPREPRLPGRRLRSAARQAATVPAFPPSC